MIRAIVMVFAAVLVLGVLQPAAAHHPPLMERCAIFSFTGEIEQIDWRMPHVELLVRTSEGIGYHLTWRNIHQLAWEGIDRNTLRIGDAVAVTATTLRDIVAGEPMLLSSMRRISDGWEWVQDPQGC